jgi:hypothetical protein
MAPESIMNGWKRLRAPRRDPGALGFGVAFVALGAAGLLRSTGVAIEASTLSQVALILLGAAGLLSLVTSRRPR